MNEQTPTFTGHVTGCGFDKAHELPDWHTTKGAKHMSNLPAGFNEPESLDDYLARKEATITEQAAQIEAMRRCLRELCTSEKYSIGEAELRLIDSTLAEHTKSAQGTPNSNWKAGAEPDPHGTRYDCERAALCMGNLTDDELANEAFLNYDRRPPMEELISGKGVLPIAYMTAVKDRIRWLSRKLDEATTRLSGQTCFVPPEFQAHMNELEATIKANHEQKMHWPEIMNIRQVELLGDFRVQVLFASCRSASAFQRALLGTVTGAKVQQPTQGELP